MHFGLPAHIRLFHGSPDPHSLCNRLLHVFADDRVSTQAVGCEVQTMEVFHFDVCWASANWGSIKPCLLPTLMKRCFALVRSIPQVFVQGFGFLQCRLNT